MEPPELARLEIVVAAPHSALRTDADQTARLLGAISTPGVNILGHPRGRMYGSRPGVSADWAAVFAAAARTNVAIEIDGDPARQDIDYLLARDAVKSGCLFALDSDAHDTPELAYAETAIAHARLAGVPASRVVNCWPLERLLTGQSCMAPLKTAILCGSSERGRPVIGILRGQPPDEPGQSRRPRARERAETARTKAVD